MRDEILQFPRTDEEERDELEEYIKKAGIWEQVSGLNLSKAFEDGRRRNVREKNSGSTIKIWRKNTQDIRETGKEESR